MDKLTFNNSFTNIDAFKKAKGDKELKKASQEFEAYFVNLLFKQMRKTQFNSTLIEKSNAQETFESMLDERYSQIIAKQDSFGISKSIYNSMKKAYE